MNTPLDQALKLADQDCPLPALAGPALKLLRERVHELEGQQAARADEDAVRGLIRLWRQIERSDEPQTEFDKGYEQASQECADNLEAALSAKPAKLCNCGADYTQPIVLHGKSCSLLSAQPAPERQGEDFEEWFTRQDSRIEWPEMVRLAYHAHPAAPVGVPDEKPHVEVLDTFSGDTTTLELWARYQGWNDCREAMLAAAPSAPQGTQQGVE